MDLKVTCTCGHSMVVSEFAAGMTAPCPKCGQPITVSPKNAEPIAREEATHIRTSPEIRQPADAAPSGGNSDFEYTPLRTTSLKNNCARCGREFRGDWDRHPSSLGLVCNICQSLIANQKKEMPSSGYVAPVDTMKLDPDLEVRPQEAVEVEEVEESWREKYMPDEAMMRRIAIGGAVAFGLYTVWILLSGAWAVGPAPEDLKNAADSVDVSQVRELPAWAAIVMRIMTICSGFVSAFVGVYVFLTLSRRLPDTTFLANAIQILPATAIITVLYFSSSILPVPFAGTIVTLFFIPAVIFISFGFETQDIINYPLGMVLGGVLQGMFYMLIYWLIGSIAL